MTTELVELADCICGAVVDQEECPYPSGRDLEPGTGRQVYVVNCTNENCGWQCLGYGADGARKAWNTRVLASRAGGWRTIESAPRDRLIMIAGGTFSSDNYHDLPQKCATIAYWYRDHWRGDDMPAHDDWKMHKPTHWQPLPEPPAAPEPVAVGSNNSTNDEER